MSEASQAPRVSCPHPEATTKEIDVQIDQQPAIFEYCPECEWRIRQAYWEAQNRALANTPGITVEKMVFTGIKLQTSKGE